MAGDHKEVQYLRLYVKEPGSDRLRKTAESTLKHMLAAGWRETAREREHDYLKVRLEREGVKPRKIKIRPPSPPPPREGRGGRGGPGARGGAGGRGGGGRGGSR